MIKDVLAAAGLSLGAPDFWLLAGALLMTVLVGLYAQHAARRAERLRAELERIKIDKAGADARAGELSLTRAALAESATADDSTNVRQFQLVLKLIRVPAAFTGADASKRRRRSAQAQP